MTPESSQKQFRQLRILSNPTRLDIYTNLWTDGPGTALEIASRLGTDDLLTYYHLRQMVAAGLLEKTSVSGVTRNTSVFSATSRMSIDNLDVTEEITMKAMGKFVEAIAKRMTHEYRAAADALGNEIHKRSHISRVATRLTAEKQAELKRKITELSEWIDQNSSPEGDRLAVTVAVIPLS